MHGRQTPPQVVLWCRACVKPCGQRWRGKLVRTRLDAEVVPLRRCAHPVPHDVCCVACAAWPCSPPVHAVGLCKLERELDRHALFTTTQARGEGRMLSVRRGGRRQLHASAALRKRNGRHYDAVPAQAAQSPRRAVSRAAAALNGTGCKCNTRSMVSSRGLSRGGAWAAAAERQAMPCHQWRCARGGGVGRARGGAEAPFSHRQTCGLAHVQRALQAD